MGGPWPNLDWDCLWEVKVKGQGHEVKKCFFCHFGLVRTISQKVMDGFSPNLHRICILDTFPSLLKMGDPDLTCMINRGVIFSPTAFKLGANRDHIEMFNISSGFF